MRKVGLTCFSILLSITLLAQARTTEFGFFVGTSYYIGDINPYGHFKNIKPAGGFILKRSLGDRYNFRAGILYTQVAASDADASDVNQINRNLHFRSSILELSTVFELSFLPYQIGSEKDFASPYLFAGLSYFRMNPQAKYNDDWVDLQPLGTEGQGTVTGGKRYPLDQIAIPFGLGFKINLGSATSLGFEYGIRKTFTDYLDDVSTNYADPDLISGESGPMATQLADRSLQQEGAGGNNTGMARGNPNDKDWFYTAGITLTFKISKSGSCYAFPGRRK